MLEQIVGDIEDEFDETEEDSIFPEGENQWRVRAATEISHFNDVFGSKLPDDEYDSVGGWMGGRLGRIPRRGDHAEIDGLRIEVARGDARRALWLRVRRLAGPHSAPIPPKHEPPPRGRLLRGAASLTLAGAAHALTFAPGPLPGWALAITQVLALAVAARVTLYAPSARQSWARGWLFSFATYALGLYWIFISLHRYGDLAAPLAAAAVLLLSAFLAIFPATACALARHAPLEPDSPPARALTGALTWAALWAGFEWVRAVLLTGFPWLNIGYAHVDSPLAGWAPLLGVHGMAWRPSPRRRSPRCGSPRARPRWTAGARWPPASRWRWPRPAGCWPASTGRALSASR